MFRKRRKGLFASKASNEQKASCSPLSTRLLYFTVIILIFTSVVYAKFFDSLSANNPSAQVALFDVDYSIVGNKDKLAYEISTSEMANDMLAVTVTNNSEMDISLNFKLTMPSNYPKITDGWRIIVSRYNTTDIPGEEMEAVGSTGLEFQKDDIILHSGTQSQTYYIHITCDQNADDGYGITLNGIGLDITATQID